MDIYSTTYLLMFLVFLGLDIGLTDSSSTDEAEPDPTDPDAENPLYEAANYTREVEGTEADDTLSAGAEADLAFFLNAGNDVLEGSAGDDYANGGAGDDLMTLREGNDIVIGGDGNDSVDAGIGFDIVGGGLGDDHIDGNGGNDSLYGAEGTDTVLGGSGADSLHGGAGNDYLSGLGDGISFGRDDTEIDGVDTLHGDSGDDTLLLGAGDIGTGGEGADTFQFDHRNPEFDAVQRVTDFGDGDLLELHYDPAQSGTEPPSLTVSANADNTAGIISFNGQVVAEVMGGQALTAEQIRLVAAA